MLDAAVAGYLVLVGAGVEEAYVERVFAFALIEVVVKKFS